MAVSSKINFIIQISESCLMIENPILKDEDEKDETGVSQDGNIHIIYISSYCSFCVNMFAQILQKLTHM